MVQLLLINYLRPGQNDHTLRYFKCIYVDENGLILIQSFQFIFLMDNIKKKSVLILVLAWRREPTLA